ncbi:MAG TPA: rhodanese-like domain-containing protein [Thermoanaerobaculia bacterium]|nr:rhodanese-like domain-containing protein [Thermoanaerobaculia bacterium]
MSIRRVTILLVFVAILSFSLHAAERRAAIVNPAIDMPGYLDTARKAAVHREDRRLSEGEFIRMSGEQGTVVLDARSREKFDELHVHGAINLSFPDITIDSLAKTIPDQATRVLIYCNNNFINAEDVFPSKAARASLNLSTYIALYGYGYRNVYELGPLLDIRQSRIRFDGSLSGK